MPATHAPVDAATAPARSSLLDPRGLFARIVFSIVALVAVVQFAAAWVATRANSENARDRAREELVSGSEALRNALYGQRDALRRSAQLLAADAGLIDAADPFGVLQRLAQSADLTASYRLQLIDVRGLRAGIAGGGEPPPVAPAPLGSLVHEPRETLALVDRKAYEIVEMPTGGGRQTLVVARSFDDERARQLREYTGIGVTFLLVAADGGAAALLGSSLPPAAAAEIAAARRPATDQVQILAQDSGDLALRTLALHQADGARLELVASRALDDVLPVFERLRPTLVAIAVGSLALTTLAAYLIARLLLRPLQALTAGAQRIRDGDYRQPISIRCGGELAVLMDSLNHMRVNIAQREERITHLAYDDRLTGLPNRARLIEHIEAGLRDAQLGHGSLAVMMLDIDRFKQINDTLGHAAGDEILRLIAARLNFAVRPSDTVARLGGDEFAIALPGTDADAALEMARHLRKILREPLEYEQQPIDVGASIGIAMYPNDGADVDTLLRCADIAMYAAKRNNASIAVYDARHEVVRREYLSLLSELRRAVGESQLRAYYQPIIELSSGRVIGAEALVRWRHPTRGLLTPAAFLPYAEQTGYVWVLTRWMLAVTLRQCGAWAAAGLPLEVAVNISTRDLVGQGLVQFIAENLQQYEVPPALVTLEITEGVLMKEPEQALAVLQKLRALGVKLAIDDFGTGFSSLAYLKQLPVHELKIDATFVRSMMSSAKDASIVRSTIQLAHNLQLRVVAEGVEDDKTLQRLRDLGCDLAQGYLIARPMRRSALEQWVRSRGSEGAPGAVAAAAAART